MSSRYGCVVTEPRARIDELPVLPQHAERHESRDYKLLTHFCLPRRHDHRSGLFAEYIAPQIASFRRVFCQRLPWVQRRLFWKTGSANSQVDCAFDMKRVSVRRWVTSRQPSLTPYRMSVLVVLTAGKINSSPGDCG
jgi:hypothetical protein